MVITRGDVLRFASHLPLAIIFRAVGALTQLCRLYPRAYRLPLN